MFSSYSVVESNQLLTSLTSLVSTFGFREKVLYKTSMNYKIIL